MSHCRIVAWQGFATLIMNLVLPSIRVPRTEAPGLSGWLIEYMQGSSLRPLGLLPAETLVGKTFKDAAQVAARENAILLGAQSSGRVLLNPSSLVLEEETVLFALVPEASVGSFTFQSPDTDCEKSTLILRSSMRTLSIFWYALTQDCLDANSMKA